MITKEQVFSFVDSLDVCFIASIDEDGFPAIKAMLPPRKRDGVCFYLTTNTPSMRVQQYRKNDKASLYFYDKGETRYEGVMFVGRMEVLEDADVKRDIWREGDTQYYSKGVDDPDYCVLRFTAEKGRHYCNLVTQNFTL